MLSALRSLETDWFISKWVNFSMMLAQWCRELCCLISVHAGSTGCLLWANGPIRRRCPQPPSLLLRWWGELILLTSRAPMVSSPVWRCMVWLALWGQQLQEEEMETLHCHQASFSAKEQLIPETASRGKRLSKDSRRDKLTQTISLPWGRV